MRLPALAAVPLAALLLVAGCTAAPDDTPGGPDGGASDPATDPGSGECIPLGSGSASDSVTIDDADPAAPLAQFGAPLSVAATERSVLVEGGGELVERGATVLLDISMFSGATGELAISTGHGTEQPLQLPVDETQTLAGFVSTVACSHVGDRIVGVIAPDDAYGATGNSNIGIAPGETVVLLVDVVGLYAPTAPGEWTDAPEVDFGSTPPSFELTGPAPTELLARVLEEGDGEVVRYGQSVSVDYVGKSWDTGEVFDESYTSAPRSFSTAGVVEGFAGAIVGHPVGSTVIVVAPPDFAYGQPTGAATDHPLAGQTLVFVLEIREIVE